MPIFGTGCRVWRRCSPGFINTVRFLYSQQAPSGPLIARCGPQCCHPVPANVYNSPTCRMASSAKSSRTGGKAGSNLIWVDLELTGLEPHGRIMEIACLVTDPNLKVIGEGVDIVVHQPDDVLNSMNEWCTEHHGKTGLTEACRNSRISMEEAEQKVLEYVSGITPAGKCPLAGNSIHTDRVYLEKDMPKLTAHCHYRIVDVSSIKELCRRWYPGQFSRCPPKLLKHRALEDIKESIEELKYYRHSIFVSEDELRQRKDRALAEKEAPPAEPHVQLADKA